jgi:membrane-bound serine protease (ClpP class)
MMKATLLLGIVLIISGAILTLAQPQATSQNIVYVIPVEGEITKASGESVIRGIHHAEEIEANAILILLDTPGGIMDITLDINKAISNSNLPVITYVYPSSAMAASAGTYILLNGHTAAMAPGTTIGACKPYYMTTIPGVTVPEEAINKTVAFSIEQIKNIAKSRGRNETIAEKFITEDLAIDEEKAYEVGVIDVDPRDSISIPKLLATLDGREVLIKGEPIKLKTTGVSLQYHKVTLTEKVQNVLGNPAAASLFLMLGILLLIFGIATPEYYAPELIGAILLILGIYGIGLFSANVIGIVLIALGAILFLVEIFTPSFGVLGIAGIIALALGTAMLPKEPWITHEWMRNFQLMGLGISIGLGVFLLFALVRVLQIRRKKPVIGGEEMTGLKGEAITNIKPKGQVKVKGEIWRARSETEIKKGEAIEVIGREGILLKVKPLKK